MSQPQPSEIPQMSQPQPSEIPVQEINVQQTNDNEKPKDINTLSLNSNVNEPLLEKSDEMEENRKKRNSTSFSGWVVGGIGGIILFGFGLYYIISSYA